MTRSALVVYVAFASACGRDPGRRAVASHTDSTREQTALQQTVQAAPKLPLRALTLTAQPPREGWQLGRVSWVVVDATGLVYLLQRGQQADPVVVVDTSGRVVRSWGKGMYTMPHAIRIDPQGNIWTTDAATSMVYQFDARGRKLMEIAVGGQPSPCVDQMSAASGRAEAPNNFCGATDVAFAPNGHVFIADGYANNRVLEYSADGKKLKEWGSAGTGPGQFRLPHSIDIDRGGTIYVSDRENGRVQRFDLEGNYLGEWPNLGRIFSVVAKDRSLWLATQPLELPNGSPGWLLKLDRATGQVQGYVEVTGGHGMAALDNGDLMVGLGPDKAGPAWFRPAP